jgi:hypothetical protein
VEHDLVGKPASTFPDRALAFFVEHDLVGKPASTFPDHALAFLWSMILSENRLPLFRIMLSLRPVRATGATI